MGNICMGVCVGKVATQCSNQAVMSSNVRQMYTFEYCSFIILKLEGERGNDIFGVGGVGGGTC